MPTTLSYIPFTRLGNMSERANRMRDFPFADNYPISQLRIVNVVFYYTDDKGQDIPHQPHLYYMHKSQVETFVSALVALHHEPGVNPHTGGKTSPLWEIKVCGLETDAKSYWWCDPALKSNDSPCGARINQAKWAILAPTDRVWACPTLLRKEHMERERELKAEYEEDIL